MRDARVARLAAEDRLQDRGALELVGVGLVVRGGGDVERDRVADLRLVVFRIALRQGPHRLQVCLHALAVRIAGRHRRRGARRCSRARVACSAPSALPFSSAARPSARFCAGVGTCGLYNRLSAIPQWAMAQRGIGGERLLEQLFGRAVPERMLIPHGAIEAPLRHLVARGGKVNRSELRLALILGKARRNPGEQNRGSHGGERIAIHRGHAPLLHCEAPNRTAQDRSGPVHRPI